MIRSGIALALALIAAPYVLYPLALWLRSVLFRRPCAARRDHCPDVDLVICAHDESASIGARIENALALDYPRDRLTIWIASDGSSDDTVDIARRYASSRVRVLDLPRGGKAAALNRAVGEGRAPVIAFSDANSEWRSDALRALVAPLADPAIGGVAGDQRYASDTAGAPGGAGERGYWSYDRQLKRWQSASGSVISATGAIYAIRRSLFQPAPPDATDDFMISTAVIARGSRLVFAEDAVAVEPVAATKGAEFRRKVRIITRGLRGVRYRAALLNPLRYGAYSLDLLLHKGLRRLAWMPLLVLLLLTPLCAGSDPACLALAAGLWGLLLAAGAGWLMPGLRRWKPFAVAGYVVMVNVACALATVNTLRGTRVSHWSSGRSAGSEARS